VRYDRAEADQRFHRRQSATLGIVVAVMLLVFVLFGSSRIEKVPMAALTGLMIMVALGTFEWASLRTFTKRPKSDIFVMVMATAVTVVTVVLHNLELAVIIGF
jgi:SulP family sulfate permease